MKPLNISKEYQEIVKEILDHPEFQKLKEYKHHGITRWDHSLRVSYECYLYAKKHHFNEKSIAKAALVHDFFFVNHQKVNLFKRIKVLFTHPKMALENAKKIWKVSKLEENIILSHMFPLGFCFPKYKESWLVVWKDDIISIVERFSSLKKIDEKKSK